MSSNYYDYSKPSRFLSLTKIIYRPLLFLLPIFLLSSLYLGLYLIPSDALQGENYKIIYIHVPFAWLTTMIYGAMVICSAIYLIKRNLFLYIVSKNLCLLGILCNIITLITGSLWGLPVWGTLWVWDARLTSVLILLFIYIAYYLLSISFEKNEKGPTYSSIFCLIGFINIPIIKFSVDWWTTLHQPSSITSSGSSIHMSMIYPMVLFLIFLILYVILVQVYLVRSDFITKRIDSIEKS